MTEISKFWEIDWSVNWIEQTNTIWSMSDHTGANSKFLKIHVVKRLDTKENFDIRGSFFFALYKNSFESQFLPTDVILKY